MKQLHSFLVFSDLWPFDLKDRAFKALVLASVVGLTIVFSKHLSLPETALSAYLVLFAVRPGAFETIGIAIALIFAALFAVGLLTLAIMATSGQPALRVPLMFVAAFGCFYLASGSSEGAVVTTAGMIIFEVLSALDVIPFPDLVLRGMFWLIAVVMLPMGLLIVSQLLLGRLPLSFVRNELGLRQKVLDVRVACDQSNKRSVRSFFLASPRSLTKPLRQIRNSGFLPSSFPQWQALADGTARNLALSLQNLVPHPIAAPIGGKTPQLDVRSANNDKTPFSPDIRFALVATLAVGISYIVFLLLTWPEIHTITITAFLISISTKHETFYKAGLRMVGFLAGALITIATLFWIIPGIENASQLGLVCSVVLFPAAWIALSNEVVSYMGLQIALVFLLTVVNSPGPEIDLAIAWGRFCGILLGTLIVTVAFQTFLTDRPEVRIGKQLSTLRRRNAARTFDHRSDGEEMLELTDQVAALRRQIFIARKDPTQSPSSKLELDALWINTNRLFVEIVNRTRPLNYKVGNAPPNSTGRAS
ncbi:MULTISPECIES: FUSC family protein [Halocynthiibacter]|uniref:FUSC family protein n=1 Tax=Halocynthiibacter halioticoli TaxID=2986804 RepID=A0AAE3J4C2_9RHOB|nr:MULTISPECIES: FUSC family protein [Halocynthiibacter]MCV6825662.1 FUSC family protein [Halocynthiibacter halioticoli]MCW4058663.1 FUSC family protein [Halocynthiibacter sp. SDUM655004]